MADIVLDELAREDDGKRDADDGEERRHEGDAGFFGQVAYGFLGPVNGGFEDDGGNAVKWSYYYRYEKKISLAAQLAF